MRSKRRLIVVLAGLNGLLLVALVMQVVSLPAAAAQMGGQRGDFACVTAKAFGQLYDVLYLLDVPARKLHVLFPSGVPKARLVTVPPRDLLKDFNRK
ncbi:MAG: hypothetical protein ACE5EX_05090 [Phycisphaerae bacterium]